MPTERRRPRRACADRAVDTRARRVVCAVVCREAHHAHDAAARRPPWRSSLQNYGGSPSPLTGVRVCTGPPLTGVLRGRGLTGVGPTGSPYLRGVGNKNPVPVTGPPWVALPVFPRRRGARLTSSRCRRWFPFPHACARARPLGCHGRHRAEVVSGGRGGGGGRRTCPLSGAVPVLSRRAMPQGRACFQALWRCQFRRLLLLLLSRIPVSLVLFGGGDPRFTLRPTGLGPAFCMLEWPPRALRTAMPRNRGGRRTRD